MISDDPWDILRKIQWVLYWDMDSDIQSYQPGFISRLTGPSPPSEHWHAAFGALALCQPESLFLVRVSARGITTDAVHWHA